MPRRWKTRRCRACPLGRVPLAVRLLGRFVGPVNILRGGIAVDPGKHRVELRHDDYFSRYVELDLARAEKKQLELSLAPVLP